MRLVWVAPRESGFLNPFPPHKVPASRIGCPLPVTRFLQNPCLGQQYWLNVSMEFVAGHLSYLSWRLSVSPCFHLHNGNNIASSSLRNPKDNEFIGKRSLLDHGSQ